MAQYYKSKSNTTLFISYHGTSSADAANIAAGNIDVSIGCGELGRGFYSGQYLHEAKVWAYRKSGNKQQNVVEISMPDDEVEKLEIKIMDAREAGLRRYWIRRAGETRSYLFGNDMVWAPIVGSERVSGDQYKWETQKTQRLLNHMSKTLRTIC